MLGYISALYQIICCSRKLYLYCYDNGTVQCPSRVAIRVRRINDISSPLLTKHTFKCTAVADSHQICSGLRDERTTIAERCICGGDRIDRYNYKYFGLTYYKNILTVDYYSSLLIFNST
jgi:hypothetical protein